jgi:uncharacterized ubiquitin-like protein YukD
MKMEAISTKYDLDLNQLNHINSLITDIINGYNLNFDTLNSLNIQLDNLCVTNIPYYFRNHVSKYNQLSLELKIQLVDDLFNFIKDSYKLRFSKEYTLICNKVIKNYDTIDEIKKYYDFCIEFKNKPKLYKNGKEIKAEELTPIKTMQFNRLILYTISGFDSSYHEYEYKNTKFTSAGYHITHNKNTDPWVLYVSQKDLQYLIKNDFPKNTKGIVYRYKDNDDKLAMETISKSLSGFPPIIMVDNMTDDIKKEILELLL